jgi:hypothetical protein
MLRILFRAATLAFLAASTASAQSADWGVVKALAPGTQVRAEAAGRKVTGQILSTSDSAMVLRTRAGEQTVLRANAGRVAVKKKGHRGRNVLIGLGIGTGAGLGIGLAARSHCSGFCLNPVSNGLVVGAGIGAGAVIGGAVGAIIPTGGWREIYYSTGYSSGGAKAQ